MALTAFFFQNTADPKTLDKSPYLTSYDYGAEIPITMTPTGPVDLLGPTIEIDYNAALLQMNYAYIPEFGRYYYIGDKTVEPGKKITLQLSCDPLYTFAASILEAKAAITRNENVGPSQVIDNQLPVDPNEKELWSQTAKLGLRSRDGSTNDWWENPGVDRTIYVRIKASSREAEE